MGDDARRRSGRVAWQYIQDLAGRSARICARHAIASANAKGPASRLSLVILETQDYSR